MTTGYHNSRKSNHRNTKKAALALAAKGKAVFPCKPDKAPHYVGDVLERGFRDASTDRARVAMLFSRFPGSLIGMPTGERTGVWVLDVDPEEGGFESLRDLEDRCGPLPATLKALTRSGGWHLYFAHPGFAIKCSASELGPGLDVRGEGGYVIVPPSPGWGWEDRSRAVAEAPGWLLEAVMHREPGDGLARPRHRHGGQAGAGSFAGPHPQGMGKPRTVAAPDEPIPEGGRNHTLFFRALAYKDGGYSREQAHAEMAAVNQNHCQPPLPAQEVSKIVDSAYRYPLRGRTASPEVEEACSRLKREWWSTTWSGLGRTTERDIMRVFITLAERYGQLIPTGLRVSASYRQIALASGVGLKTVQRAIKRFKADGRLRADNAGRKRDQAGSFVLLAPAHNDHTPSTRGVIENQSAGVVTLRAPLRAQPGLPQLPEKTPCFRHRGFVGKTRGGILNALEVYGPHTDEELAERLGFSRVRDMRRRHLGPLLELGLITESGAAGSYALAGAYEEHLGDVLNSRYGGGERKVRRRDGDRLITVTKNVAPKSEVERAADDRRKYEKDREERREIKLRGVIEADPAPTEEEMDLRKAQRELAEITRAIYGEGTSEKERSPLAEAIRAWLEKNPHDACQPPGWLGTTVWSYDMVDHKPTPQAARDAVEELGGESYLVEKLRGWRREPGSGGSR